MTNAPRTSRILQRLTRMFRGPLSLLLASAVALVPAAASAWTVTRDKGEMNDKPVVIACLSSENSVPDRFRPVTAQLCVRSINERTDAILLTSSMTHCWLSRGERSMAVRSDDQPAEEFICAGSDGGSTDVSFFVDDARPVEMIRSAKRLIRVQVPLVSIGNAVFRFNVAGKKLPRELIK